MCKLRRRFYQGSYYVCLCGAPYTTSFLACALEGAAAAI
jgi:hypothetical protein